MTHLLSALEELRALNVGFTSYTERLDVVWVTHSFYSPEPVIEEKRPFFPKVCALLENSSGYCFGIELARPTQTPSLVLRELILKQMELTKIIPAAIVIGELEHLPGIGAVAESLDVEIKLGPSEHGLEFEDEFRDRIERDGFM